jgi:hypothetical protein
LTAAPTPVPFCDLARDHAPLAGELRAAFDRVLGASAFIHGREVERFEADAARAAQRALRRAGASGITAPAWYG